MNANKKGPIVDPGKCRCCGMMKKCRILNFEYESLGKREVYSEMFVDCFGLVLSHLDVEEAERLICATCVVRLRDAVTFRHQVLQCEQKLLSANVHVHDGNEEYAIKVEVEIKEEVPIDGAAEDNALADPVTNDDSDDSTGDDVEPLDDDTGSVTTNVKRVSLPRTAKVCKTKSTKRLRREVPGSSGKMKLHASIQKMKDILNKTARKEPRAIPKLANLPPEVRQRTSMDKEFNTIKNTLTIIENSYVTPFINMFSDFHCVYCREMFIDPEQLRQHTLEHDPRTFQEHLNNKKTTFIDVTRIDCRLCQTHIDSIDSFKQHIVAVHNKRIYKDVDTEFLKFKLTKGKLNCLECEKTFNFFQALKRHMAEHFGTYICDVCGSHYFEERHLIYHKKTHAANRNIEMFPCSECDKSFRSKNSRNFHTARIHRNEAAYPCNQCDEIFISYHMRYRHKINVHGEKREFPCENCDKVYDCRKTLREHFHRTHLQLLRHECTLCDKKFYLPSALRDHMTSHTGERLYRCDYCGKTYPRKKALKVHLQSHNTEKKYKCSLCPSSYTQANNFKNHMKSKHPMPPVYNEGFS